jgi:peptidoglycan hydrolase CwlO-like protein
VWKKSKLLTHNGIKGKDMFVEWSLLTVLSIVSVYLFVKMFYFKSITSKEQRSNDLMKLTLQEAEILIRKYQIQLQRALGNVDILSDELTKLRNELKVLKQRNTKHRQETDRLNNKIKALESRIDALL